MRISWEYQPQIKLVAEAPSQFHPPLLDWDWICRSFPGVSENWNGPFPAMPQNDHVQPGKTMIGYPGCFLREPIFRQTQMGNNSGILLSRTVSCIPLRIDGDGGCSGTEFSRRRGNQKIFHRTIRGKPKSPMFLCVFLCGDDCVPISKSIYGESKRGTCLILSGQSFLQIPIFFQDNIV